MYRKIPGLFILIMLLLTTLQVIGIEHKLDKEMIIENNRIPLIVSSIDDLTDQSNHKTDLLWHIDENGAIQSFTPTLQMSTRVAIYVHRESGALQYRKYYVKSFCVWF